MTSLPHDHRFRKEWVNNPDFKDWLARCKGSDDKAYCTVCKKELCAGKSELMRHHKGKKHMKKMEKWATSNNILSEPERVKTPDTLELSTVLDENGISHVLVRWMLVFHACIQLNVITRFRDRSQ